MCWQCLKTNQQTKIFHVETRFPSFPEEVRNSACACHPGMHGLVPSAPTAHCTLCAPIWALWASRFQPRLYRALRTSPALPCSEWAGGVRALHPFHTRQACIPVHTQRNKQVGGPGLVPGFLFSIVSLKMNAAALPCSFCFVAEFKYGGGETPMQWHGLRQRCAVHLIPSKRGACRQRERTTLKQ